MAKAGRRIERGDLRGARAVAACERREVLGFAGDGRGADEEDRPLVGVGAEDVRHPRVLAAVEERARLVGQEAAVDQRPEGEVPARLASSVATARVPETRELVGRAGAADGVRERGRPSRRLRRPSRCRVVQPPLSLIARWKSLRLPGDAIWWQTSTEPADSPKIVTFFGLPPNAAMFSRTHSSAAR